MCGIIEEPTPGGRCGGRVQDRRSKGGDGPEIASAIDETTRGTQRRVPGRV